MMYSNGVADVGVESREREIGEGGGESSKSLDGVLRETRSTHLRTLPRPHVRKDLQYRRQYGTPAGARKLIELITVSTGNAWYRHIAVPESISCTPNSLRAHDFPSLGTRAERACRAVRCRVVCELGLANEGSRESLAVANPSNAVRGRHWLDWVGVHK